MHDNEHQESPHEGRLITAIGAFKVLKGLLLLAAAVGCFELLGKDLSDVLDRVVEILRLAPDGRLVNFLYEKADTLTDGRLKVLASVSVTYGILLSTEGYGLLLRRKWAELLVVVGTLIPVPFELYELFERPKLLKVGVLLFNLAIVAYLIRRRREFTTRAQRKAAHEADKPAHLAT